MSDNWRPLVEVRDGEMEAGTGLAASALRQRMSGRVFINTTYQVVMRNPHDFPAWVHLAVRRWDDGVWVSWADKMRIKDQLIGAECEAIELFPAQSRLVDLQNVYHLWGYRDPGKRIEVGFNVPRLVT